MKVRDERVEDLFFVTPEPLGLPEEEGQVRLFVNNIYIRIAGRLRRLTNPGYVGDGLIGVDAEGDDIVITSSALASREHKRLRDLIHFIDQGPADGFDTGAFKEILPAGSTFPTSVTWYADSGKTQKIVEKLVERSAGAATNVKPTPITWIMYAENGVDVVAKVIDSITYSSVFEYQVEREIKMLAFTVNERLRAVDMVTVV